MQGYGKIITKEEMIRDRIIPTNQCATMYMKPSPDVLPLNFFNVGDPDITHTFYSANYRMPVKEKHIPSSIVPTIVRKYHPDAENLYISDVEDSQNSSGNNYAWNNDYLCVNLAAKFHE